ncbi:unnamed protein product [Meloidogyne enterolobii]|uniref:Uncharacterized protein n=1 Tax=Meloidogyne enterolobii TaxID=390850 RepID=A0ACB0Z171_MELEN
MVKEDEGKQERMECEEEEEEMMEDNYDFKLVVEEHDGKEEQPLLASSSLTRTTTKSGGEEGEGDENNINKNVLSAKVEEGEEEEKAQKIFLNSTKIATSLITTSLIKLSEKEGKEEENLLMNKQQIDLNIKQEVEMSGQGGNCSGNNSGAMAASGSQQQQNVNTNQLPQYQVNTQNLPGGAAASQGSRYQQLVAMIDELGKDIRPTYNGNRNCQERLKRGIVQARLMVRECMAELEKSRHQQNATSVGVAGSQ